MKTKKTLLSLDQQDREIIKITGIFVIPSDIDEIAGSVFLGCEDLKTITIPKSVKKINRFAFYNCKNLKSIKFCSIPEIGSDAFTGCPVKEVVLDSFLKVSPQAYKDLRYIFNKDIKIFKQDDFEDEME